MRQTEIARLEQLQYRAAKIVTGAVEFTSKEKLNAELGWETLSKRSEILGLNMFHKIHKHETRPLIRNCMPKIDLERKHVLRSNGGYIPFKNLGTKFNSSFFPYHSKLWNTLPKQIQSSNIEEFKIYTHKEMKHLKCKHFSKGNKDSNTLLTKIRVGRSSLNLHKFSIEQIESPECACHFKEESVSHFFLDCFLYTLERRVLFSTFEHYIQKLEIRNYFEWYSCREQRFLFN